MQSGGKPISAFFAFDPQRTAILLWSGNKAGNEQRCYQERIPVADGEFTHWLKTLKHQESGDGQNAGTACCR
ncbi:hypothetical protein [Pantoea sp. RHCKP32]|uniref:hypothetical protein n=1 Tax=Pantoea sp. RHCKP32 TaxID=3425182 RepID=UPI003D9FC292